jgi:hypothetical protein
MNHLRDGSRGFGMDICGKGPLRNKKRGKIVTVREKRWGKGERLLRLKN